MIVCPTCEGSGFALDGASYEPCSRCNFPGAKHVGFVSDPELERIAVALEEIRTALERIAEAILHEGKHD